MAIPFLFIKGIDTTVINLCPFMVKLIRPNASFSGGRLIGSLKQCPDALAPYIVRNQRRYFDRNEMEMVDDEELELQVPRITLEELHYKWTETMDVIVLVSPEHHDMIREKYYRCFEWAQSIIAPRSSLIQHDTGDFTTDFWYAFIK